MSYEIFQKCAALNGEFEIIPTKLKLYAEGIVLDDNGYMKHDGKTYVTNMVKLADLPKKIQPLFVDGKYEITKSSKNIEQTNDKSLSIKIDSNLSGLSKVLLEQLQNIVDPEDKNADMANEIKKANAVCNIADKIITIVDLSLKVEILNEKKRRKRIYE
jgi:hypothetical protein